MSRDLEQAARQVRAAGRRGDTVLAHINPEEAALLRRLGGSGTLNPRTGLPEFSWGSEPGSDFGDDDKAAGDLDGWAGSEGGSSWGPDRGPGSGWNGGENNPETRDFARKEAQRYIDERYGSVLGDLEAGRYGRALERGLKAAGRGLAGLFGLSFSPELEPGTGRFGYRPSFDPLTALATVASVLGLQPRLGYAAFQAFGPKAAAVTMLATDPKVVGSLSALAGRPFARDLGFVPADQMGVPGAAPSGGPAAGFGSPGEGEAGVEAGEAAPERGGMHLAPAAGRAGERDQPGGELAGLAAERRGLRVVELAVGGEPGQLGQAVVLGGHGRG